MTRNQMDFSTVIAVAETVKAHCRSADNAAVYDEGWSDERVRDQFTGVTIHNVAGVRERLFGKLYRAKPKTTDERIEALELRLAALESWAKQNRN